MRSGKITNWDRTLSWRPEAIHQPRDDEEIARVIRRAGENGKRIKALGSVLSWSDIIDMPEQAIRFDKMADVLEVDRDNRRVRLQAGARLKHVNALF